MGIYNLGGGGGAPELQAKEATPLITNAQQIILPDEGYDGLSKVTVNPMPAGALKTPTVNSIGYVSSGVQTAGYFDTSATSGLQLSTQAAKTITPTTYSQTAVASGKYTTGAVTVGAVSLQSKTANPSGVQQVITADSMYTGLQRVTVTSAALQTKSVRSGLSTQHVYCDSGYYGIGQVEVDMIRYRFASAHLEQSSNNITLNFSSSITDAISIFAIGSCLADVGGGSIQLPYVITCYVGNVGRLSMPGGTINCNYSIVGNNLVGYPTQGSMPTYNMVSQTLDAYILY